MVSPREACPKHLFSITAVFDERRLRGRCSRQGCFRGTSLAESPFSMRGGFEAGGPERAVFETPLERNRRFGQTLSHFGFLGLLGQFYVVAR